MNKARCSTKTPVALALGLSEWTWTLAERAAASSCLAGELLSEETCGKCWSGCSHNIPNKGDLQQWRQQSSYTSGHRGVYWIQGRRKCHWMTEERYQLREGTPLTVLFVQVPKAGIEMQVNLQMQIYVDFKTLQRHGTTISAMQKDWRSKWRKRSGNEAVEKLEVITGEQVWLFRTLQGEWTNLLDDHSSEGAALPRMGLGLRVTG